MLWRLLSAAVGVAVVFTMARSERRNGDGPIAIALGSKGPTWAATVLFPGTFGSGIFLLGGIVNTLRNR